MNNVITLTGIGSSELSATDAARVERDGLLAMAKTITNIAQQSQAESAATALRSLKGFTRQIEDARTEVKAPVLDLSRRIDTLAKELTNELETEASRISRILGTWQAEQKRLEEEAQRKAREEEQRIWQEAQAKAEAERQRLLAIEREAQEKARQAEAELLAKANRARSEAGKAKALEEAETLRIQRQIEADERQAQNDRDAKQRTEEIGRQMVAARIAGNQVVAAKPVGVATREEIIIEVTDIHALYRCNAIYVTMTPNLTILKSVLKSNPDTEIAGIRWHKEAKTHVR